METRRVVPDNAEWRGLDTINHYTDTNGISHDEHDYVRLVADVMHYVATFAEPVQMVSDAAALFIREKAVQS